MSKDIIQPKQPEEDNNTSKLLPWVGPLVLSLLTIHESDIHLWRGPSIPHPGYETVIVRNHPPQIGCSGQVYLDIKLTPLVEVKFIDVSCPTPQPTLHPIKP